MRLRRLVAIALLAGLGVLVALLANDVRRWHSTMRSDAVAYSAAPGRTLPLTAPTILPAGASGSLLSVSRDQQWLSALRRFVTVYDFIDPLDHLGPGVYSILNGPETSLAKLTQDPSPARASQAYDLLAVLLFRSAYPGTGTNTTLLQQALTDLQDAVRVDGSNETAKKNLELAIRVLVAKHGGRLKLPGPGTRPTKRRTGANALPPGAGF
jgi:hypothetical protein